MPVVHRSDLPHVAAIIAACAALATALTLFLASTLNDFGSGSVPVSRAAASASVPATAATAGSGWALSPFTSLLRTPVRIPWAAGS